MTGKAIVAGFSKVEITPPLKEMEVCGLGYWYQRSVLFTGIRDPIYVRAAAIGEGQHTQLLLSVEAIYDSYGFIEDSVARIEAELGVPSENILITCTHTHSAPMIGNNNTLRGAEYGPFVAGRMTRAARLAQENRKPCSAFLSSTRVDGVLRNRRPLLKNGQVAELHAAIDPHQIADPGVVNDILTMLKFRNSEGALVGGLCHLGIHGVSIQCSELISSDCMGNAVQMLEDACEAGAVFLHLNAPCGDIDPLAMGNPAALGEMSTRLFAALQAAKYSDEVGVTLRPQRSILAGFTARRRDTRSVAELRSAIESLSPTEGKDGEMRHHSGAGYELFVLREEEAVSKLPSTLEVGYQIMRMGDVLWAGIGGEVFTETGLQLAARVRSVCVLPVGITGKSIGYLPPADAFAQGGYEVSCARWCTIAPGETERLFERIGTDVAATVESE
jgi:neutral ceramidase